MDTTVWLSDLVEKFYDSLSRYEKDYIQRTELKELTQTQIHYLDLIYHRQNPSLGDIAAVLHVSRPSVTVTIDKLESSGYVKRVQSDADKRSAHVHLTEKGERSAAIHDRIHYEFAKKLKAKISEQESRALCTILSKVLES